MVPENKSVTIEPTNTYEMSFPAQKSPHKQQITERI